MNTFSRIMGGTAAFSAAFGSVALAGSNYEAGPTVADNGASAGLILLLAVGAILVLKSINNPPPSEKPDDESAKKE
jgi:hypothetical protein